MALHRILATAATIALGTALAGCGGSGGSAGGSGVVSTPPPVVPPPPPAAAAPPIGLTQQGEFATLAVNSSFTTRPDGLVSGDLGSDLSGTIQFRYLGAAQGYEVQLPGLVPGRVETTSNSANENYSSNIVRNGNTPGTQQAALSLYRPGAGNTHFALTYTSYGIWGSGNPSQPGPHTGGYFAYGVPTAAGDVPTSGTGTYNAVVHGITLDSGGTGIGGEARLVFDFAAGTLGGFMRANWTGNYFNDGSIIELGQYDFTQTVFGVGSPTFSGRFNVPGSTASSFFEGRLTGPQAAELMARWQAPYLNPATEQWSTMQGVWLGRRTP